MRDTKSVGNKENLCKNVKRISSFLRDRDFFENLQNFDSEIDGMILEGTISLLISRCSAMVRFSDSCVLAFIQS